MSVATITVGDFIDTIEQNGLPQVRGTYLKKVWGSQENYEACALGQAFYNFWGVSSRTQDFDFPANAPSMSSFVHELESATRSSTRLPLTSRVIELNDQEKLSITEIVATIRKEYADSLDVIIWESNKWN